MQIVPRYPLETERLCLRPFTRGDMEALFAYRSREDVARYLLDPPLSRHACLDAVQARVGMTKWTAETDKIYLAVERREDRAVLGEVVVIRRQIEARQAELGYIFHPDHFGRGYATEASRRMLQLAFEAGAHRVYARCHPLNEASWRLMQRLGMQREAHFTGHAMVKGRWDEEFVYAILENDWRASG